MSTDPLISVIVPVFNGEAFLGDALNSVVQQTYGEIETIVVDDGSDDRSLLIAQSYGATCLTQGNQGPAAARNCGIRRAQGEFIAFLDADDRWQSDKSEQQLSIFRTNPELDMVFGATCNYSAQQKTQRSPPILTPLLGAGLFRRNVFARAGMFTPGLRGGEFIEWLQRCRSQQLSIRQERNVVLFRRIHATNHSRRASTRRDVLRALKSGLDAQRSG